MRSQGPVDHTGPVQKQVGGPEVSSSAQPFAKPTGCNPWAWRGGINSAGMGVSILRRAQPPAALAGEVQSRLGPGAAELVDEVGGGQLLRLGRQLVLAAEQGELGGVGRQGGTSAAGRPTNLANDLPVKNVVPRDGGRLVARARGRLLRQQPAAGQR